MNRPEDRILFMRDQLREAEAAGFPRNLVNRNLRLCITHYWGSVVLGFPTIKKTSLPRSLQARERDIRECRYEHAVPMTILMNQLLLPKYNTPRKVRNFLQRLYRVCLVTVEEDQRLRSLGYNSRMPDGWDCKDPWARYRAAGIRINRNEIERAHSLIR